MVKFARSSMICPCASPLSPHQARWHPLPSLGPLPLVQLPPTFLCDKGALPAGIMSAPGARIDAGAAGFALSSVTVMFRFIIAKLENVPCFLLRAGRRKDRCMLFYFACFHTGTHVTRRSISACLCFIAVVFALSTWRF